METLKGDWKKHVHVDYLNGEDFGDKVISLTVKKAVKKNVFNPNKGKEDNVVVLYFEEIDKGIVLGNVTTPRAITKLLGSSKIEDWIGKKIPFWGEPHKRFGQVIRVKINASDYV